ncbi:MAG: hypothetical protein JW751_17520 [Polyangiaceae bacterium]|nr:hypothetical protein [Polyangiaceae bacterium]
MRAPWVVRGVAVLCLVSAVAAAQSDETTRRAARDLGNQGIELYEKGDYPAALDRLKRAYEVMPVVTLGLWSARALEKNGRLVEASERYLAVTRTVLNPGAPDIQREALAEAQREYDALQPRIPSITITLAAGEATGGVEIAIDGEPLRAALLGVPIALDPGPHQFGVTREGKRLQGQVQLAERDRKVVELTFKTESPAGAPPPASPPPTGAAPAAAPPPGPAPMGPAAPTPAEPAPERPVNGMRIGAFVALGVGAAGLLAGGIGSGLAIDKKHWLDQYCFHEPGTKGQCPTAVDGQVDEYNRYRSISTVGYVIGAIGVAGGFTLLLLAPRKESAQNEPTAHAIEPWIGLGAAGLRGRF